MTKWCYNYDSGEYEYIDKDGFSIDRGEYVYNWDDSEYRREEEKEQEQRRHDDEMCTEYRTEQLLKEWECMYIIFSDEVRSLEKEIKPWIIGRKGASEDYVPIFKENTPSSILQKYDDYISLLKKEVGCDDFISE